MTFHADITRGKDTLGRSLVRTVENDVVALKQRIAAVWSLEGGLKSVGFSGVAQGLCEIARLANLK